MVVPHFGRKECFIATVAYGSQLALELDHFRKFRDSFLSRNIVGVMIVYQYYRFSPYFVKFIENSTRLRLVIRLLLNQILKIIR